MKLPKFIKENLLLKITSLNAVTIIIRLFIAFFINREITDVVSKGEYAKIGNLRNLMAQLSSITSLGVFNGIVKYVAEYKEDKEHLQKLFSTTLVFTVTGSIITFLVLFFAAPYLSNYYFNSDKFTYIIKIVAVVIPFISIQRVFNGVINGLSKYKSFAKIELLAYIVSATITIIFLYRWQIDGVLIAIAIVPIVQVLVMLFLVIKILREYVQFKKLKWKTPLAKSLFAFSLMSFFSTILLNQVEVEIRNMIEGKINEEDAGIWTGLIYFSKNYMVFSNALLALYVIPKFSKISFKTDFLLELKSIYKTLLPLFGVGMILIYLFRDIIINLLFQDDYSAMSPLFKWQLIGDFIRLCSIIIATQFIAKKLVRNFIFTEILSLGLFFIFSYYLVDIYGVEGVTIAHLLRYIIYFGVVFYLVMRYYSKKKKQTDEVEENSADE